MKHFIYLVWAFFIVYPLGSCAADHNIDDIGDIPADITMHRERRDIIVKNFFEDSTDIQCITPLDKFDEVNEKFLKLIDRFHYDDDLKFYYGLFLIKNNQKEGIKVLAEAIESLLVTDVTTGTLSQIFIEQLKNLCIKGQSPKEYLDNLSEWFCPSMSPHRISYSRGIRTFSDAGIKKFNRQVDHEVRENIASLLDLLKDIQEPTIYDATLNILTRSLEDLGHRDTVIHLIPQLYLNDKNKEKSSPRLKILYASGYLMKNKKYFDAIPLYESVLKSSLDANNPYALDPDNPYQTVETYNSLVFCYLATEVKLAKPDDNGIVNFKYSEDGRIRLERGITLLENALCLDSFDLLTAYHNLAHCQFVLGEYALASINIEKLLAKTDQHLATFNKKRSYLQKIYELILQKSGRSDELTSILLEKQKKALQENKKIANLIMQAQEQYRKEREEARHMEERRQNMLQQSRQQSMKDEVPVASQPVCLSESKLDYAQQPPKETECLPTKKEKKKTRRIARHLPPMSAPQVPEQSSLIHINMLTNNKGAWKTFDNLFSKYLTGYDEKISLNEIGAFFKALGQDYNASKGKGSHKKVTLNFQNQGVDMKETIITLTNKTYLKPEQIDAIRLAFAQARIVPNNDEIIQKLREKGVL